MLRDAPEDEQVEQDINHFLVCNLTGYQDSQAFPSVFIDYIQYLEGPAISRTVYHEIIAPDMVLTLRPEPDTRTII